jgi:hypothetical protein
LVDISTYNYEPEGRATASRPALNAEGIAPRRSAKWHGLTVNKILTGKERKVI